MEFHLCAQKCAFYFVYDLEGSSFAVSQMFSMRLKAQPHWGSFEHGPVPRLRRRLQNFQQIDTYARGETCNVRQAVADKFKTFFAKCPIVCGRRY